MKRKLSFLFLSALTIPFFMGSCSDDKEEQEVKPATDLVVDNNSVTLLQGDEITVSIISGNGDYYVKPFDESVATATINGNKVTIKATENSQLEENNRVETTILVVDGRKKVARVKVQIAKLWDLTVDAPEEGFDLFIGEKRLVKILTGNGDYQISIPEGADKFLEVGELSGQVIPLTAKFETGADPVNITITDKKGKTITIPVVVNIVDLTLKSNEATFAEPDAESQYIAIEKGNGGYIFTYQVGDGEPTTDATIVEATEKENLITLKPKARGDVKVIVTDQKGSVEEIEVKVNPYQVKANVEIVSIGGFRASAGFSITRGNGGYELQELSEADKELMDVTDLGNGSYKVTAKKLGSTTLVVIDQAGEKLELPVNVNPVAANIGDKYCFFMDTKNLNTRMIASGAGSIQNLSQVTYEIVFYPYYTRSMQSFIGLEGYLLLRAEEGKDINPHFQIAFKVNGKSNPYFLSKQTIYSDRNDGNKPGKWYHIAVVFDGTQPTVIDAYKLYINGEQEELTGKEDYSNVAPNATIDLTQVNGDPGLMIGRSCNDNNRIGYSYVYQARVWKTARTATEIKENMCDLKPGYNEDDLLGYWLFSDGVATTKFEDLSGHGLDAQVYKHNPFGGVEFPATEYKPVECPHSY